MGVPVDRIRIFFRWALNSSMPMHYQWVMLECTDVGISFQMGLAQKTGKSEALGQDIINSCYIPFPTLNAPYFLAYPYVRDYMKSTC